LNKKDLIEKFKSSDDVSVSKVEPSLGEYFEHSESPASIGNHTTWDDDEVIAVQFRSVRTMRKSISDDYLSTNTVTTTETDIESSVASFSSVSAAADAAANSTSAAASVVSVSSYTSAALGNATTATTTITTATTTITTATTTFSTSSSSSSSSSTSSSSLSTPYLSCFDFSNEIMRETSSFKVRKETESESIAQQGMNKAYLKGAGKTESNDGDEESIAVEEGSIYGYDDMGYSEYYFSDASSLSEYYFSDASSLSDIQYDYDDDNEDDSDLGN